ncbi:MAG: DNA methyltransferase [Stellaceae bacterium]
MRSRRFAPGSYGFHLAKTAPAQCKSRHQAALVPSLKSRVGERRSIGRSTTFTNGGHNGSGQCFGPWLSVRSRRRARMSWISSIAPRGVQGVVFDPFMGSGTTIGEAVKLGARAIGRDINPVAHFLVRNALAVYDRAAILRTFRSIEADVAAQLKGYYTAALPDGTKADALYYFWVKVVSCLACNRSVDLFSS